jgi:PAS domain S-box-containing protein
VSASDRALFYCWIRRRALVQANVSSVIVIIAYMSAAAERILGWQEDELLGRDVSGVLRHASVEDSSSSHPDRPLSSVRSSGYGIEFEDGVFARKDGTTVRVSYSSAPIWEAEAVTGSVVVFADTTEQCRTMEALVESEMRGRLLFERNPIPMWIFDVDTLAFLDVNEAAVFHYGYLREEFLSMSLRDIRPPEDLNALIQDIAKKRMTYHSDGPWKHRRKDGSTIDVESHGTTD